MKKLFIALSLVVVIGCASQPRQILPQYKSFVEAMPEILRIVKLQYPDLVVIRQLPDHYYVLVAADDGRLGVVAVSKKDKKPFKPFMFDDAND